MKILNNSLLADGNKIYWSKVEKLIMESKPYYGLPKEMTNILCKSRALSDLFEAIVKSLWLDKFKVRLIEKGYKVI